VALRHVAAQLEIACREAELPARPGGDLSLPLTVSIGVAVRCDGDADFDSLLRRADAALYRAKAAGRNRVEVAA